MPALMDISMRLDSKSVVQDTTSEDPSSRLRTHVPTDTVSRLFDFPFRHYRVAHPAWWLAWQRRGRS